MNKFRKLISYILVAALASALTLAMTYDPDDRPSKLDQLERILLERFIGEKDQTAMEDAAAKAMVESLGDRWSHYMSATAYRDYKERMANSYVGIGITIQAREDQIGFDVLKVNENGPADQAGMLAGDILIGVEGQSVEGMNPDQARDLVRGKENTQVSITVLRNGEEVTLSVTRMQVQTPVATAKMLEGNVGLVTIVNFDSRCASETIAAIEQLLEDGAEKLIFDVRNNPGGYADELVKVLDYLLPKGELFRTVDYRGKESVDKSDAKCLEGVPMAVLVNGNSYSAAEFFAAALSEYEAAVVVGEPTTGKGYFQVTYELVDGSAVGVSIGKYFTPKGKSLAEEGGIVPDVEVAVDEETFAKIYAGTLDSMEDPQILAAISAMN